MNVGAVGGGLVQAVSLAQPGSVQGKMAVSMLKKSQEIQAETAQKLIDSTAGLGQRLNVVA